MITSAVNRLVTVIWLVLLVGSALAQDRDPEPIIAR
jgi:hypothetical protein